MTRSLFLVLVLALALGGTTATTAAEPPIEINTILSQTGQGAFLGRAELQSLQIVEGVVNKAGGIRGRPIHFVNEDDQASPQLGLQLATALAAKKVPVIIGPSLGAVCNSVIPVIDTTGPVLFCLSPVAKTSLGGYAFAPVQATADNYTVAARYFRELGLTRFGYIASTDASGQIGDQGIAQVLALPENRSLQLVAQEHFAPNDINVSAQIARIRAANPQVLFIGSAGTPFGTVLHAMRDVGLSVPVVMFAANGTPAMMQQYAAFLPTDVLFATYISQAPPGTFGTGALHAVQTVYDKAMRAAGIHPDVAYASTWDPAMMVVDAYRRFGPDMTAAQLHDWLERLRAWTGINGEYDFVEAPQRGIRGSANLMMFRWDPAKQDFTMASRPGGALLH